MHVVVMYKIAIIESLERYFSFRFFFLPSTGTALEAVEAKATKMAKTFNVDTAAETIAVALIQDSKVASVIYLTITR